jgi:hypothetical protein
MQEIIIERRGLDAQGNQTWVPYKYTYNPESDFIIDPENLDGEMCKVGQLMIQYGEAKALLEAQMERHKKQMEFVYSKLFLDYKDKPNTKTTDASIKANVTIDPEYQRVSDNYIESCRCYNTAESWYKTAHKKADLLQSLAYKWGAEVKRGAY